MRKKILSVFMVALLFSMFLSIPTFAEEGSTTTTDATITTTDATTTTTDATTVDPGITPDQALYFLDQLLEKIQLTFTFDEEAKANLLSAITQERLTEITYLLNEKDLGVLTEEEVKTLLTNVVSDYQTKLEQTLQVTEEIASKLTVEEKAKIEGLVSQITLSAEIGQVIVNDNQELLEDQDLQDTINKANILANVVKDLDQEKVAELRDLGLGFGQIAQAFALSEATGKELSEIADVMKDNEQNLSTLADKLGISVSDLAKLKHFNKKDDEVATEDDSNDGEVATEDDSNDETNANGKATKTMAKEKSELKDTQKQFEQKIDSTLQEQKKNQLQVTSKVEVKMQQGNSTDDEDSGKADKNDKNSDGEDSAKVKEQEKQKKVEEKNNNEKNNR